MNIFKSVQIRNTGTTCQKCVHFENDPAAIEKTFPGLTVMSSGFASVRDRDGLCNYHQLYLSAGDSCESFAQRTSQLDQIETKKELAVR
jgi:hypothetical protein